MLEGYVDVCRSILENPNRNLITINLDSIVYLAKEHKYILGREQHRELQRLLKQKLTADEIHQQTGIPHRIVSEYRHCFKNGGDYDKFELKLRDMLQAIVEDVHAFEIVYRRSIKTVLHVVDAIATMAKFGDPDILIDTKIREGPHGGTYTIDGVEYKLKSRLEAKMLCVLHARKLQGKVAEIRYNPPLITIPGKPDRMGHKPDFLVIRTMACPQAIDVCSYLTPRKAYGIANLREHYGDQYEFFIADNSWFIENEGLIIESGYRSSNFKPNCKVKYLPV